MIGILFLLQGQLIPSGNGVTHHLEVGKLIKQILKVSLFLSAAGSHGQQSRYHHNLNYLFHVKTILFIAVS